MGMLPTLVIFPALDPFWFFSPPSATTNGPLSSLHPCNPRPNHHTPLPAPDRPRHHNPPYPCHARHKSHPTPRDEACLTQSHPNPSGLHFHLHSGSPFLDASSLIERGIMLPLWRNLRNIDRRAIGINLFGSSKLIPDSDPTAVTRRAISCFLRKPRDLREESILCRHRGWELFHNEPHYPRAVGVNLNARQMTTVGHIKETIEENSGIPPLNMPERIKVKRLDKTARHIMNILDKEAVDKVKADKDIPHIQAGCIIELKVEAPENKGRISTIKGLVIARKNAGISTTIQVRRLEANVGVDTIFPLYSPNIKGMKVLEKRSVRRAKLYYVRDRPFNIALKELAQRTAKKKEMVLRGKRMEQSKK